MIKKICTNAAGSLSRYNVLKYNFITVKAVSRKQCCIILNRHNHTFSERIAAHKQQIRTSTHLISQRTMTYWL